MEEALVFTCVLGAAGVLVPSALDDSARTDDSKLLNKHSLAWTLKK